MLLIQASHFGSAEELSQYGDVRPGSVTPRRLVGEPLTRRPLNTKQILEIDFLLAIGVSISPSD